MWDVIVVGAGPAGSAAGKKCAEYGFKTLIMDKRKLPRNKVCSGLVNPPAQTLIKQEFGDIPEAILSQPPHLNGMTFHVPGVGSQTLHNDVGLTWRRDLDYWLNQKAQAAGVEIWQASRLVSLRQEGRGFSVRVEREGEEQELEARFVVGADGVTSTVRSSLFPEVKMNYVQAYQEHYRGELELDKRYFHSFRSVGSTIAGETIRFGVHHKGEIFLMSFGGRVGQVKELVEQAKSFLAENYNFDARQEPLSREGCLEPVVHGELIAGTFLPARGNAMLVGDAGGFILPVILDGIIPGLKSGLSAARAIKRAAESGKEAGGIYLAEVEDIISKFKAVSPWVDRIAKETESGGGSLPEVMCQAADHVLKAFEP